MGSCNSTKSSGAAGNKNNKTESSPNVGKKAGDEAFCPIYSINQFGNTVVPINDVKEPLKFEFKISNIKGKNFPKNQYFILRLQFANEKNLFTLPLISGSNPKFNFEKNIALEVPFHMLDSTYFEIQLYSLPSTYDILKFQSADEAFKKSSLLSRLKVDLLTITIGPEHHDICLLEAKKPNNPIGRISFNINSSHIEQMQLKVKNVQCKFYALLQNDVSMKLKVKEAHTVIESENTEVITPNRLQKEEVTVYNWIEQDIGAKLSLKLLLSMMELRSSNASINFYDMIYIDPGNERIDNEKDRGSISAFNSHNGFARNFVKKASARFSVFNQFVSESPAEEAKGNPSNNDVNSNKKNPNLKPKFIPVGSANLNFYKILSENDSIITKQSSRLFQMIFNEGMKAVEKGSFNTPENMNEVVKFQILDNVTRDFHEEIYFQGVNIGSVEGALEITRVPLIRQIMCGVHTEHGFDIHSISLHFEANSSNGSRDKNGMTAPPELRILANQTNNLLQQLLKGTNLTQFSQSYRDLNSQTSQIMREIKQVLEKSSKESCLYYQYSNNKDLFEAQGIMLKLGIEFLKVIESFNLEQRAIGFEILNILLNRAEFDLGTVSRAWFVNQADSFTFRDQLLLTDKIIENFIYFNNLCLEFSLDRLSRGKSIDKECRVFVEFVVSVSYFRIPLFREAFLHAVSKDIYIEGQSDSLSADRQIASEEDFLNLDPVNSLILWDSLFYKRLNNSLKSGNNESCEIEDRLKEREKIIFSGETDWKQRLQKRGIAFYSMINKLEEYIRRKVVKVMDLKWLNIPGFPIIIDAIMHELKAKETTLYTQQQIEVLTLFINDAEIINNFTKAMLTSTKVYDTTAVFTVVKIIDSFFSEYEKKKNYSNLHLKFDYTLLRSSFRIILEIDHSLSVAKYIWLYYRNAHIMNFEHVGEVFTKIFDKRFFELFFHWSWQVRNIFYYTLFFIINHRIRKMQFSNSTDLSLRRGGLSEGKESSYSVTGSGNVANYPQIIQANLMAEYEKKMKIVEGVKQAVEVEKLDPSFNTIFRSINKPEFKDIPKEVSKNIVVSIHHLKTIEEQFTKWEEENRRKKYVDLKYPPIDLEPPKDDVIQYSEITW